MSRLRPLALTRETLLPLGDESLRTVQGGMLPVGSTEDCPVPPTGDCTNLSACCLSNQTPCGETGTTTSINRPTSF
ncbi:MAG TPA: hypothetical protein VFT46_05885 [Holophagaceae bacterium]|nr:hypothetical protein [Holophagaceae bacterium]